jgi:hypothetical protein
VSEERDSQRSVFWASFRWFVLIGWVLLGVRVMCAPTVPDEGTGRVYPFNNHGTIHYVTALTNYVFLGWLPAMLLIGAALNRWWKRYDGV